MGGGVGDSVGCGIDASKIDAFSLTIDPKLPVLDMQWCPSSCYTSDDQYEPACDGCIAVLPGMPDTEFRVPTNVYVDSSTANINCHQEMICDTVENYQQMNGYIHSDSGFFSSSSTTSEQFFYESLQKNYSLSLQANFLLSYSVVILPPYSSTPEFQIDVASLPATYAGNEQAYQEFIDSYGTDFITGANMGGQLVANVFFESCFLATENEDYVSHSSSSSIFGIAGDSSGGQFSNTSASEQFKQWSDVSISLLGGNGSAYGVLGWNNTINPTQLEQWKASIMSRPQPVKFSMQPITSLITDANIAANVKAALASYGASVNAANENLINTIMAGHPVPPQPSWCHMVPPGERSLGRDSEPAAVKPHDPESLGGLPLCPPLPSPPAAVLHKHSKLVAEQ